MKTIVNYLLIIGLLINTLFLPIVTKSQGNTPLEEQVKQFKGTTTLIVLDGSDVMLDAMLRNAVTTSWTITPFDFIGSDDFAAKSSDSQYSFLVITQTRFRRDPHQNTYHFLNLLLPHPTGDLIEMPVMAYVPFLGDSIASNPGINAIGMLVKLIQGQAEDVVNNPKRAKSKNLKHINKGIRELKNKKLLVAKEQVDARLREEDKLLKAYKNSIEVVSSDSILSVINNPVANQVVLHIVSPNNLATSGICFKMIIEPKTGAAYYYKTHTITPKRPGVFLKRDFRKIRWAPLHWL